MTKIIFLFIGLSFSQGVFADKYKDSFIEAAYSGNVMLVKTHLNDLRGSPGKDRHNEALRAAVSAAAEPATEAPSANSKASKIAAKFKGSTTDVVKMLLAAGANPNDQSFGRPTIFSVSTNPEIKALLEAAGGKLSVADQLAVIVKDKDKDSSPEDFQKALSGAQPGELKLGNGLHIPSLIFATYDLKTEGDLIPYMKNQTPLVNMYVALAISKKATDLFVVYDKSADPEFGRKEKTESLIGRFLDNERWDLLEIVVDHNEIVPEPFNKQWAEKWFNYRKNLMLSLIQSEGSTIKDPSFERMNHFLDGTRIKKFDDFAKKLPPIEPEKLDQFFLESEINPEDKLKLFEELSLKISAPTMASYITKKDPLQEQDFRRLEKLTQKGKPFDADLIIKVFEAGNLKTSQQILRLGANPDSINAGDSGLCIAIKKNNYQLAQLLLSYKATPTGTCNNPVGTEPKTLPMEKLEMTPQMRRLIFKQ